MKPEFHTSNTLIIGAGAAGLACAACLKNKNIDYILLEKHAFLGHSWRKHYDRLHLHTDKYSSHLPFLKFPAAVPKYPSRDDVVNYLENYAEKLELIPRFHQKVQEINRDNGEWQVKTEDQTYSGKNVIIATGFNRKPYVPSWEGIESFRGPFFHSSEYINGVPFQNRDVLVVGFGNSACEIALCLYEHGARPALAVRRPVNILPRDILGIPVVYFGLMESLLPNPVADLINKPILKMTVGNPESYGLRKAAYGPITEINKYQKIPVLDVGTLPLIKKGKIRVFPGVKSIHDSEVLFDDGRTQRFDAIIAATGYRPVVHEFLKVPGILVKGERVPASGKEIGDTGLYFCGFNVAAPGMLRAMAIEAKKIAKSIKAREKKSHEAGQ